MSWKKAAAFAVLATISFTGNYLVSASMVTAKADEAIAANVPGGNHMNEWCDPSKFDRINWIASWALRDLDLDSRQQELLDTVMAKTRESIASAETICSNDREAMKALPAPEQLQALRAMLGEAERIIGKISGPFAEFHASLSADQVEKLKALMNHRGRWHRKG